MIVLAIIAGAFGLIVGIAIGICIGAALGTADGVDVA